MGEVGGLREAGVGRQVGVGCWGRLIGGCGVTWGKVGGLGEAGVGR